MNTQIYATFGPACAEEDILKLMIEAGMTGMRLNLSHTTLPDSRQYIENYHNAAKEKGVQTQILIDMQGPELRIGRLEKPEVLTEGSELLLGTTGVPIPQQVIEVLEEKDEVLLDDGRILLKMLAIENGCAQAVVLRGGTLLSHKSVKIVGKDVVMPALTEHDLENIKYAKE